MYLYGDNETMFYFSEHVGDYFRDLRKPKPIPVETVVLSWKNWGGETQWTQLLRQFGQLGGLITHYCGLPRSKSAIPLTFTLHFPSGEKIDTGGNSRLRDIKAAIQIMKARG
jgi:hypothetical protein